MISRTTLGCTITMTLQQNCGESVFDAVKATKAAVKVLRTVKVALRRLKPLRGGESVLDAVKVLQKKNGRIGWNRVEDMTAELYDNVNDNENLS